MSTWFRNKRYGYGASPANWKGWLATLVFLALIFAVNVELAGAPLPIRFGAFAVLLAAFIWIVWNKSEEGRRWRWGSDDNNDRNR